MKVKDTYNLLKEGNVEEAMNMLLKEMDATEKVLDDEHIGEKEDVKPVEGKENTEAPKAEVSEVEKDLEADHAAEGEEVGEVVVKEEEGDMPEATEDKKPEEVCPVGDGVEVEKDLEADHVEEKKDVEPELVKEESAAEAVKDELEKEHVGEDEDLEPVEVKEDAVSEDNLETNPEEGKEVELHTGEEPELKPEVKDELERQEELKEPEKEVFAEEKPEEDAGLLELFNLIDKINSDIEKLNEESVEDSLEAEHVGEDEELELADGKENTEAPKAEVSEVEKDLEAEHVGEDEELELADGKENTEAPKAEVSEVEDELEKDHAEEEKDVEGVEIKEAAKRKYTTDNGVTKVDTEYTYYKDKDADENRVSTKKTVTDKVDGSSYVTQETDKEVHKGGKRDYGTLEEEISNDAEVMGTGDKPEEKEYDVDAAINSAEMNGNDEEFKDYEKLQGEEAEAAKDEKSEVEPEDLKEARIIKDLKKDKKDFEAKENKEHNASLADMTKNATPKQKEEINAWIKAHPEFGYKELKESVNYSSLKEAYLLGGNYFKSETVITESAEEKQHKLVEQLSMLAARESNDALYEAVIEHATALKNLKEAIIEKYSGNVNTIADTIINK